MPARPPGLPSLQEQVRSRLAVWRQIGAPSHVLRWLREGVRIEWLQDPPPPFHHGVAPTAPEDLQWVSSERDRCLLSGAWRRATDFDFVSRAFIVTHKGKRRVVFNLKYLNSFCAKKGVKFGSLSVLRRMMRHGDYMWSIDLKDAYHLIGIHPSDQKYFTFALETDRGIEYFSTSALNFGWTRSPQVFTEVMKPVVAYLRNPSMAGAAATRLAARLGVSAQPTPRAQHPLRVLPWLDDFAFFSSLDRGLVAARASRDFTYAVFDSLGVTRNVEKGQSEPAQQLDDHLGFTITSDPGRFLLTTRRVEKLRSGAMSLLREAASACRMVRARALASFAGLGQASHPALARARCWLRSPYDDLSRMRSWASRVRLCRQSLSDLRQFTRLGSSRHVGRPIWRAAETRVGYVDAGPLGWGGELTRPPRPPVAGFWTAREAAIHITWRELRAVRLFVLAHVLELSGHHLLLHEDNQAVVAILASLTSRSPELMAELRLLIEVLDDYDISIRALYIRSELNVVADLYSRVARHREYILRRSVFEHVCALWGSCSVDAFASQASAQLHRFWSEAPTAAAEGTDAFAQDWEAEALVWAHPPPHLLPRVAQLLRERTGASALVCTPHWPGTTWFADLMELSSELAVFPAGSLQRVAFDAPPLLETWAAAMFRIDRRA